jgi:hypothetical protein
MSTRQKWPDECTCCSQPRRTGNGGKLRGSHGLCHNCYTRWLRAGKPAGGPQPPSQGHRSYPRRLEGYMDLLSIEPAITAEKAAARLGVCARTIERYRAALR